MDACTRNMQSDPAEIKPAQCCIKLVFHLTYISHSSHIQNYLHSNTALVTNQRSMHQTHLMINLLFILYTASLWGLHIYHKYWICVVVHVLSLQVGHHISLLGPSGPNKEMWWLTYNDNTRTSGRCTSFKYSWWWALAPETCRVTLQK